MAPLPMAVFIVANIALSFFMEHHRRLFVCWIDTSLVGVRRTLGSLRLALSAREGVIIGLVMLAQTAVICGSRLGSA